MAPYLQHRCRPQGWIARHRRRRWPCRRVRRLRLFAGSDHPRTPRHREWRAGRRSGAALASR